MPSKFSFGKIQLDVSLGQAGGVQRDPETPFGLAVVGDFSGRSSRGVSEPLGQRRVWPIDCDNFETVMRRLDVRLRLPQTPPAGEGRELRFESLEDFHPDKLLAQAGRLTELAQQRRRLLQPATAVAAAAALQTLLTSKPISTPAQPTPAAPAETDGDTLSRLLGGKPQPSVPASPTGAGQQVERLIRNVVAPSVVPATTPQQAALLSAVDLELTSQLRSILHHPQFQALEAAWRGMDLLVRKFGGEENLKLYLVDISKEELAADLQAVEDLAASGICKLLEHQAEQQPWAVWVGQYTFGASVADFELLGRLAKLSAQARAPFLAGASPLLAGCDSFEAHPDPRDWKQPLAGDAAEAWQALRVLPQASYLGLVLPRFLLRLPYGKESEPIESFPFEEFSADIAHEDFLWGNPALVCGCVLAEAFRSEGWDLQAGGYGELDELPVYKLKQDGEISVKPCAEAWLSERGAEAIRGRGLMPLLSVKGRDAVRLAGLQSLAGKPLPVG